MARKQKDSKEKKAKKDAYFAKLVELVQEYPKVIIVGVDHVGSKQMAAVRSSLRGKAVILMGKNTMIRKCLADNKDQLKHADVLADNVHLNVGFVFCKDDPAEVRKIILENRVPAPARQGVVAPKSVGIPAGPTGMDPSQTSFFQALGMSTKIVKGQIEIQNPVDLIQEGTRVTASQSVLLQKLGIKPFSYGLATKKVIDNGAVYDAAVLDITNEAILAKVSAGVMNIAALSRAVGYPTKASAGHSIVEGFKHCVALCLETDVLFPQMKKIKEILDNPDAFKVAAPVATAAAPAAAVAKEVAKEETEESDGGMLDLFG